jgi:hypothetical protein
MNMIIDHESSKIMNRQGKRQRLTARLPDGRRMVDGQADHPKPTPSPSQARR